METFHIYIYLIILFVALAGEHNSSTLLGAQNPRRSKGPGLNFHRGLFLFLPDMFAHIFQPALAVQSASINIPWMLNVKSCQRCCRRMCALSNQTYLQADIDDPALSDLSGTKLDSELGLAILPFVEQECRIIKMHSLGWYWVWLGFMFLHKCVFSLLSTKVSHEPLDEV